MNNQSVTPLGSIQDPMEGNTDPIESQNTESGQEVDLQKPVTLGEVQQLMSAQFSKLTKDLSEQNRRRIQSSSMQSESRLQKQIAQGLQNLNSTIEQIKAVGGQITPEQIQNLKNGIYERAYTEAGQQQPRTGAAGQNQNQGNAQVDAEQIQQNLIAQIAENVYQEAGVVVYPEDPEASAVDMSTPAKFLKTLTAAAEKKKARTTTNPNLRTAGNGANGGNSAQDTLLAQYQKELAALPRGNGYAKAMVELNAAYRKKGLKNI